MACLLKFILFNVYAYSVHVHVVALIV